MKKKIIKFILFLLLLAIALFFFYFNNTSLADTRTVTFYNQLKDTLRKRNLSPRLLVISTKRIKLHNAIQVKLSGAASKSRHLSGDAIDFIVFDVNKDGNANSKDVDIIYNILDQEIIKDRGGIGTYKNERSFVNRQMIHIDCRDSRARWAR